MSSLRYLLASFGVAVALQYAPGEYPFDASQHQLADRPVLSGEYVCEHPPYKVLMVSQAPLVIYIQNFLTTDERAHLQRITYVAAERFCTFDPQLPGPNPYSMLTRMQKRHLHPQRSHL
jgi:hypothetical protein